uniref:Small ribosomal subunit protein eS17 n=1 Tax=Staphylothermus marinus TaxID=2280 RepID=A0A7J3PK55_STAMA
MGKIRIRIVKRTARELIEKYREMFTRDFEHNKRIIVKLINVKSKKLRNQIAGYVTHLIAIESKKSEKPVSSV